jgi:CDP-paratose 2-epimerase
MYGGRQFATYDQGWVGWFCQQALEQQENPEKAFTISGNGKQVRDVLHAEDMISLYYSSLENKEKVSGMAFNVGGGIENSLSLLELFSLLESITSKRLTYEKLPVRSSDQRVFVADYRKLEALTGWKPKVTKEIGIRKMIDWLME